jgi:hypothetical protein
MSKRRLRIIKRLFRFMGNLVMCWRRSIIHPGASAGQDGLPRKRLQNKNVLLELETRGEYEARFEKGRASCGEIGTRRGCRNEDLVSEVSCSGLLQ